MSIQPIVLYIHVPKAGGTTLADWIYDQVRASALDGSEAEEDGWLSSGVFHYPSGYVRGPYPHDIERIRRVLPRQDLRAVLGHFRFGIHRRLARPATYITMLRHPLERVLSLYHFEKLVQAKYGEHQGVKMPPETTLTAFVESPPFEELDNGQTRRISGLSPQIGGCTRAMLNQAKDNLSKHFTVVGLTERFDETLVLLGRAFSWREDLFYYPQNTNPGRPAVSRIPQEAIDAILTRNAFDHELYEFAVELLESAIKAYGPNFQQELDEFKCAKQAWYEGVVRQSTNAKRAI